MKINFYGTLRLKIYDTHNLHALGFSLLMWYSYFMYIQYSISVYLFSMRSHNHMCAIIINREKNHTLLNNKLTREKKSIKAFMAYLRHFSSIKTF